MRSIEFPTLLTLLRFGLQDSYVQITNTRFDAVTRLEGEIVTHVHYAGDLAIRERKDDYLFMVERPTPAGHDTDVLFSYSVPKGTIVEPLERNGNSGPIAHITRGPLDIMVYLGGTRPGLVSRHTMLF